MLTNEFNEHFNDEFWIDPSSHFMHVDPNLPKFKVNTDLVLRYMSQECYRDNHVYYDNMEPLFEQNVDFPYADYIIYANPTARMHDFTPVILNDIKHLVEIKKPGAEIILVGKSTNVEPYLKELYPNEKITFLYDDFVSALAKKFELKMRERYMLYDKDNDQFSIWPVNGCNMSCGFCRRTFMEIPFKSIPLEYIKVVLDAYKQKYPQVLKNVSLRAENLTEYGLDIYGKQMLHEVLDLIQSYDEVENIDIPIGMNIGEITDEILDALCRTTKIKSIVMNLETGSNRLLKLINKPHTSERAIEVFNRLRKANPEIFMESGIIVGLPTETNEDIKLTAETIEACDIDKVFLNKYSYVPKHPIAKYPQLDEQTKAEHVGDLLNILNQIHNDNFTMQIKGEPYLLPDAEIDKDCIERVYNGMNVLLLGKCRYGEIGNWNELGYGHTLPRKDRMKKALKQYKRACMENEYLLEQNDEVLINEMKKFEQ